MNIGNPAEITILEFAEEVLKLDGQRRAQIVYRPLPQDDPKVRQPDITRAREAARLGAEDRSRRGSTKNVGVTRP